MSPTNIKRSTARSPHAFWPSCCSGGCACVCRAKHGSGKGYSRASFASVLPEYSLADQDTIKSAFLPTSFTRISQLPNKLK